MTSLRYCKLLYFRCDVIQLHTCENYFMWIHQCVIESPHCEPVNSRTFIERSFNYIHVTMFSHTSEKYISTRGFLITPLEGFWGHFGPLMNFS